MTTRVVPVSILSAYIRQLFETDDLLSDVWVEGEVSEMFVSRAGHIYFTLRDADSQIKSVLFKGPAQHQRFLPQLGDQIAAHGRVSTYEKSGVYQLYVDVVEHAGKGLQALLFEQLRQKLDAEGLFDESRKRPLPALPCVIGVVTSAEGAVWHDIQTVLRRRYPLAHLILSPSPVQGESASTGIVAALDLLQRDGRAEVIIVGRGGGSAEDLAGFNDERVARAVFACRVPVISAVGHETDWTIIDLVADVRAATPSAAAELVAPSIETLFELVRGLDRSTTTRMQSVMRNAQSDLAGHEQALERHAPQLLVRRYRDEVARLASIVEFACRSTMDPLRSIIQRDTARLRSLIAQGAAHKRLEVSIQSAVLEALSPGRVLGRGYAVLADALTGSLILDVGDTSTGRSLIAYLESGEIRATVDRVDEIRGVGHNEAR